MDMGSLGTALVLGISALGSAIGISIAGQASIGAWKKCYMSNKGPVHSYGVRRRAADADHLRLLLMQQMKGSGADPAFLFGLGIASGVAIALSAVGGRELPAPTPWAKRARAFRSISRWLACAETVALFVLVFSMVALG